MPKIAIIIGAGPAGLTAAYELLHQTDIKPIILEKTADIGGLSKTVNYKGNRIDIGGHRFFSKSDRVMDWWLNIFALEQRSAGDIVLQYRNQQKPLQATKYAANSNADPEKVMLVRKRVSRIYYLKKFFSYPVTLSWDTIQKLGVIKIVRIFFSYLHSRLFPRREEKTLEDFFINRFGKNLYRTFFKDYTEKVWGIPCEKIPAEWGAQRIKELSVTKAIMHAFRSRLPFRKKNDLSQKGTETTLIQHFLYPKYGPGQLWEEVARIITNKGGVIHFNKDVKGIGIGNNKIESVKTTDTVSETGETFTGDYFFSTMPVKDLIAGIGGAAPREVATIAEGLQYRDFITIGMLVKKIKPANNQKSGTLISDNWIYIQEKDVKVGRLQIFNNWSPYMVKDPGTVWLGLEYFCNKEDSFWNRNDADLIEQAIDELVRIELIDRADVLDHTVIRMEKTYPAYFGTYDRFDVVRDYVNQFNNLFLIGRNGMHKYNNADHSMLTAMQAVENIKNNISSKEDIWKVNTEEEYNG